MRSPRRLSSISLEDFGDLLHPDQAVEPILPRPVRAALLEWLTEIWARDELAEVGLKPRARALFYGPPGTGKTTLAHHLAARLGLPMIAVRPDRIIDCLFGSSGRNLGALFDAARPEPDGEGPVVMFFDEFDTLAGARQSGARDAGAERNAIVNVLLQRIDQHDGIIIAATNLARDIDPAIWRRFDIHISLDTPGQEERERILSRYLAPYGLPAAQLASLADACETASPALLRQLCEGLKRNIVLGPRLRWDMAREAVFGRLIASIEPHASLGKPRLWSLGVEDRAIRGLAWPVPLASDIPPDSEDRQEPPSAPGSVVEFTGGRRG